VILRKTVEIHLQADGKERVFRKGALNIFFRNGFVISFLKQMLKKRIKLTDMSGFLTCLKGRRAEISIHGRIGTLECFDFLMKFKMDEMCQLCCQLTETLFLSRKFPLIQTHINNVTAAVRNEE